MQTVTNNDSPGRPRQVQLAATQDLNDPNRRAWLQRSIGSAAGLLCANPLLAQAAGLATLPTPVPLPAHLASLATPADLPALVSAWNADGLSWAGLWLPKRPLQGVALPSRAHQLLAFPNRVYTRQPFGAGQVLVVARRPGEFLMRLDVARGRALQWHAMEPGRVLGGHAAFSNDGLALYTSEIDDATGAGFVAVRDPKTLQKHHEFSSQGVGPHAILVEAAGSLLVANGGLQNQAETGRRKLNADGFDSSLVRLNPTTGQVMAQWRVEDRFLSLRHLARSNDGVVAVAMQAEHADPVARRKAPLLALLSAGGLRALDLPNGIELGGYAGDVVHIVDNGPNAAGRGGQFMLSATRAGLLSAWSTQGEWQGTKALPEAGALVAQGEQWLACGSQALVIGPGTVYPPPNATQAQWDNHALLWSRPA